MNQLTKMRKVVHAADQVETNLILDELENRINKRLNAFAEFDRLAGVGGISSSGHKSSYDDFMDYYNNVEMKHF